jgi:histone acetyltransferase (RNA polymerase elongator complex component)
MDTAEKYLSTIPEYSRYVEISFFGGSFTGLPVNEQISLLAPAQDLLQKGRIDAIRLSTRPDYIDRSILDTLREYGVSIIELGVQSMDEEVLSMSNRGHSVQDVYWSSYLIKDYGFTLGLQMMVGLPGDTEDKDVMTANEFIRIAPDMVRIYPALVIKDTYMEYLYKSGEFVPLSVDDAVQICSKLYLLFEKTKINIIRIGLQPTENMTWGKDIVSGPFHPSFRELVESKLLNDMVMYLYNKQVSEEIKIIINEKSLSKLYADKKKYFRSMLSKLDIKNIEVITDSTVPNNSIVLKTDETSQIMSINDYSLIV